MKPLILAVLFAFSLSAFAADPTANQYKTIGDIPTPDGYLRPTWAPTTFGTWLRAVPLKSDSTVYLFNGQAKENQAAQFAVLDISVGKRDLQQCADAVMRLRAEYLFSQKRFSEIVFLDNDKKKYAFTEPFTREHFDKYLPTVFAMCGTASLAKQLKPLPKRHNIEPGDVIIRGGSPGHAVIVVDVATNADGKQVYLLAQSYMPAQDIHVLVNTEDGDLSPWYAATDAKEIETPEYSFHASEFMRW